jgi:dsDNA-specific endonuclease/ATPase MutS2
MGFPVPAASFEFSPIEEFYYFGKSKGTLDAGAFETTLRHFSIVSKSCGTERAVFADELESITEPGASAKIIAGLLETFHENGKTLSLFVSHLAESIVENSDIPIRIDGIDAGGLDDNLNLIVNRNPIKNHVAKSTPELIVEKLFLTSTGAENAFYERLKKKFEVKS